MTATDPNTATIAAAWASSELGQPEREVRYGFPPADPHIVQERRPQPKRAILAAALVAGVIGGAVLGVTLFDFGDSSQPPIVTPAHERAVVVGPSIPAPAPAPVPQQAPVIVAPAPARAPAAVATPPAQDTAVVETPAPVPDYPPLPPKPDDSTPEPEDPQPEPPDPVPPVPDDLGFKLPDPPKPKPDLTPDLPLAPAPKPDPKPQPPSLPDVGLQAPVKP
ncbi:hypothetical protein [Mycobacterium sp. 3519A]|uniref:hypothetical protein n=1 Tax=Mycobacterium sp. 3519A TaxID=2057184 RepID=UPI001157F045|nr:hypothetical protein [Mycobacterium sp. 3519A]